MRNRVLLSIKPKYADAILDGRKRFEFRKALFQREGIERVILYASTPRKKVVGEFSIQKVLSLDPEALWRTTAKHAGIDKQYFDQYFAGRQKGFAIKVSNPRRYKKPLELEADFGIRRAPQSFCYV